MCLKKQINFKNVFKNFFTLLFITSVYKAFSYSNQKKRKILDLLYSSTFWMQQILLETFDNKYWQAKKRFTIVWNYEIFDDNFSSLSVAYHEVLRSETLMSFFTTIVGVLFGTITFSTNSLVIKSHKTFF